MRAKEFVNEFAPGGGGDDRNERDDSDDEGIINKILQALERVKPDPFETYGGEVEDVVVDIVSGGRLDNHIKAVGMGNMSMQDLVKQGVIETLKELRELYGDQGVAEGNLQEFAPNPRDDDDDDDVKPIVIPVEFVGDGRAIFLKNERKYVSPFPRGEVFTGKAYIMRDRPQIEVIFHLNKKNPKEREAIYTKNYKEKNPDNPLRLWYDTTDPLKQYRIITSWRLALNKKDPKTPKMIDAIGQDQISWLKEDAMNLIAEIIAPPDNLKGRCFVEPRQSLTENFADGRNPQDRGDSKRYRVPTKGKISTLRKIAKQGGRRGQLAHWAANMRSGKRKADKSK